jgi:hypothetical protein
LARAAAATAILTAAAAAAAAKLTPAEALAAAVVGCEELPAPDAAVGRHDHAARQGDAGRIRPASVSAAPTAAPAPARRDATTPWARLAPVSPRQASHYSGSPPKGPPLT